MLHIDATTSPPPLPPDPPATNILIMLLPFIIFVLSALYHWRKKDYAGKSELFDKTMMTCLKSLIVYWVVAAIGLTIWFMIF
ncbi:MAG: hypothetical protein ACW97O_08205 [Candidatus Thorarchaeota archaeon]|jgi:hypothetical protein